MALPKIKEPRDGLDLLALAENPDYIFLWIAEHRLQEGILFDAASPPEEINWLTKVIPQLEKARLLKQALEELSPDTIIDLWLKKTGRHRKRGNRPELLYEIAYNRMKKSKQKKMEVYKEMVLPYLIEVGQVPLDDMGEPDPQQELAARKNFLEAIRKKEKKST